VPPAATVSTSVPELWLQEPETPSALDVEVNAKLVVLEVCDPISPAIVTVDVDARARFAFSVTDIILGKPAIAVLCWIDLVVKTGTSTSSGLKPLVTSYRKVVGLVITAETIEPMLVLLASSMAATTLTAGDD